LTWKAVVEAMVETEKGPCIVLVSGGLDSAVTLAMAIDRGFSSHALTIRYGQKHSVEIESAQRVCRALGAADHKLLDVDLRIFGGSALTSDSEVPKSAVLSKLASIPSTYVPARNTVFLSLALAYAEAIGARDIFIGVSSVDYSGYPDCRPEYIESFERTANLGTRAADSGERFMIHAPLARMSKADTVIKGMELGVDFGLTWTCYDPNPAGFPCGGCEACHLRAKGFKEAGFSDPLLLKREND
jgi:7-cyano-7-deazaguanine synthase